MSRTPLPEPSSGFRPGDLVRLALAISFLVLIVLAIVRFRNPATWHWVRNIRSGDSAAQIFHNKEEAQAPVPGEPAESASPSKPAVEIFELGQFGLALAGATVTLTQTWAVQPLAVSLLSLDALAYATPILDAPLGSGPTKPSRLRYVLPPDRELLRGAQDREGFLVEPRELADNFVFRRARLDADARYHLISLVLEQARANREGFLQLLRQDALWNVPYELLCDKPHRYRGEVIGMQGTLVWVKRFPLERGGSGNLPEYIYHGVLEQGGSRHRPVWLLFTHLPDNMPPEKDWPRLFIHNATFIGYYLKVVGIEPPVEPPRSRASTKPQPARLYFPVLVGYTVELPPPPPGEDWISLLLLVTTIVGGIVLVSALALYIYYRSERRYLEKVAQVRERAAQRGPVVAEPRGLESSNFFLDNGEANINSNAPQPDNSPPSSPNGSSPQS
ncbi:MAG: hypothetical protein RMI91_00315 [Gemmatales bacterium]|nr:hypothetical protein [Gemmatales bacterium]MDW7993074.1 hypothetical protein [Gemmatales bacterium]